MPLINLEGEREATTQNSEEYGKKVIEYLNLKGYHLEYDSNIEGIFQDKIFRNPKLHGNKKTIVEIKDTKLSLKDQDFLREIGNYFKIFSREEFYLFVFARNIASINNWKKIFDLSKQSKDAVDAFYNDVKRAIDSPDLHYELFVEFIHSTHIYQSSYEKLFQKIEQVAKDNIYNSEEEYLQETEKLIYELEKLESNLYLVKSFPEYIFVARLKQKSKFNSFWNNPTADSYVQFKGSLYSVEQISDDILSEYCNANSYIKIKLDDKDKEIKSQLIPQLIRSQIILKAAENKFYYSRNKKMLYYPHKDLSDFKTKIKLENEKPKYLSKIYAKDDGSINFVLHRALTFDVLQLNNKYYVAFDNYKLFSRDGRRIITGEHAKKLNSKFPATRAYNNSEKSKLFFLIRAIGLNQADSTIQSTMFNFNQLSCQDLFTFEKVDFEMPCKAEIGEIFEENFDYENNIYPLLKDYYEE